MYGCFVELRADIRLREQSLRTTLFFNKMNDKRMGAGATRYASNTNCSAVKSTKSICRKIRASRERIATGYFIAADKEL